MTQLLSPETNSSAFNINTSCARSCVVEEGGTFNLRINHSSNIDWCVQVLSALTGIETTTLADIGIRKGSTAHGSHIGFVFNLHS